MAIEGGPFMPTQGPVVSQVEILADDFPLTKPSKTLNIM
jgi:hypothetical protein